MNGARVGGTVLSLMLLAGCRGTLSPLSNRLKIGEESYIVFAADGEAGKGDLFASPPGGGQAFQVTFTRVDERAPALSPDGSLLAFLRSRAPDDTSGVSLVVLNLLSGTERRIDVPAGTTAVTWSSDATTLLVESDKSLTRTPAPPRPMALGPVPEADRAALDSAFRVLLGDPPLGEAGPCAAGSGICARLASGESVTLSAAGTAPVRWGTDSIAYMEHGNYVVRPLGGGKIRAVNWNPPVSHPRGLTYFGGARR